MVGSDLIPKFFLDLDGHLRLVKGFTLRIDTQVTDKWISRHADLHINWMKK